MFFTNSKFTNFTKIFRIKKHMNLIFAWTIFGFAVNIFFTYKIYRKMDYLVDYVQSLEKKIMNNDKKNK